MKHIKKIEPKRVKQDTKGETKSDKKIIEALAKELLGCAPEGR